MNVDYSLFWELSPRKLKPFLEAENMKFINRNREMWIHGLYIVSAVGRALSNENQYYEKPIDFTVKSQEEIAQEEEERFRSWVEVANEEWNRKQENNEAECP